LSKINCKLASLIANIILAIYQFNMIRKNKLNPLKDDIYGERKAYKTIVQENRQEI